jgi:hypothetical protein
MCNPRRPADTETNGYKNHCPTEQAEARGAGELPGYGNHGAVLEEPVTPSLILRSASCAWALRVCRGISTMNS